MIRIGRFPSRWEPITWFGLHLGPLGGLGLMLAWLSATQFNAPGFALLALALGAGHLGFAAVLWERRERLALRTALLESLVVGGAGSLVLALGASWRGLSPFLTFPSAVAAAGHFVVALLVWGLWRDS